MTRVLAFAAVAALLIGTSASAADETVATASPADAHPPAAEAPPAPLNAAMDRRASEDVLMTPCGPERVNDQGVAENKPHGELSVGAGTHGYNEVGGSVCQPLPGGGFVAVTAGQSRFGR